MFENISKFFKNLGKKNNEDTTSRESAKERLQLVLMQDRASVSADFLDLMRQEIVEVIKKYVDVNEKDIDVRLTNKTNEDGTTGSPALYANIPIAGIKHEVSNLKANKEEKVEEKVEEKAEKVNDNKKNNTKTKTSNKKESSKKDVEENKEIKEDKEIKKPEVEENNSEKAAN